MSLNIAAISGGVDITLCVLFFSVVFYPNIKAYKQIKKCSITSENNMYVTRMKWNDHIKVTQSKEVE